MNKKQWDIQVHLVGGLTCGGRSNAPHTFSSAGIHFIDIKGEVVSVPAQQALFAISTPVKEE